MFLCIHEQLSSADALSFLNAVSVWNARPHVVNRKLVGCEILGRFHVSCCVDFNTISSNLEAHQYGICDDVDGSLKENFLRDFKIPLDECLRDSCIKCGKQTLELKRLVPKTQNQEKAYEVQVKDETKCSVLFHSLFSKNFRNLRYFVSYENKIVKLFVDSSNEDNNHKTWLKDVLLKKILSWAENPEFCRNNGADNSSLRLVKIDQYAELYNMLKEKYGKSIVQIWPEVTDPLKFVYEDIAIATYLLILWSSQRKFQKFIDLGCGNGLLVHILNSEGHDGLGIDIRARKIWDYYPETTKLKIEAIIPSESTLYPEADWLIGNHSDELTPWIPVMAAKSSYHCNFFLLPCCSFEFSGIKYQRKNSAKSQYNDYLDYVKFVCDNCGFVTSTDKLRIPSTKRSCFVSQKRTYPQSEQETNGGRIQKFISKECKSNLIHRECQQNHEELDPKKVKWSEDFTPREEIEKVRNCTQVDRTVVSRIVALIVQELLRKQFAIKDDKVKLWDSDYGTELAVLAKLVPKKDLMKLKNECGGLQTLLKNHHNIFQMINGKVIFRKPEVRKKNANWKQKPCWFFHNHPASCILADVECSFSH